MQIDLESLKPWLGRTETKEDILTPSLIDRFRATFDAHLWAGAGDVPLGIHWCLTLDSAPGGSLSDDGHSPQGRFLPPVPLPSRMWAGSDVTHIAPLTVGQTVTRRSTIGDITAKQGRSGTLVFVAVNHEYSNGEKVCIQEKQTIVYKDISRSQSEKHTFVAPDPTTLRSRLTPDSVLLFRYSALTFNGHRIHYDQPYTTEVEAYRGLVVHGPLQATLLLNLAADALNKAPKGFLFRGLAPLTLPCEIQLNCRPDGTTGTVWCQDETGVRCSSADYSAT